MQILKSKIFKNGMTKKVKHIMGNTFEIQYSPDADGGASV